MEVVGIAQRKTSKHEDGRSTTGSRGGNKFTDRKVVSINVPRPKKITVEKKQPPVVETFMVSLPSPEQLAQEAAERGVVDVVDGGREEYVGYVFAEYPTGTENYVDRVIEIIELDPREKIWYERPWIRVDPFMGALPFEECQGGVSTLAPPTPLPDLQRRVVSRESSLTTEPEQGQDESEASKDKSTKVVPEVTADVYDKELEEALMSVLELSPSMTVNKIHCMGETIRFNKAK